MEANIAKQGFHAIVEISMQPIMWPLKKLSTCIYSFKTFLISHVTYLNNTYKYFFLILTVMLVK